MQPSDSLSSSSDIPPKRSIPYNRKSRLYKILFSTLPLILVNIGVLYVFTNQVVSRANANGATNIKNKSITLSSDTSVTSNNTVKASTLINQQTPTITAYTVVGGDTLSDIANKFDISINTIRWANDLTSKSVLKPGEVLSILPVSGIKYTVKKGDTLSGIANKFGIQEDEILSFNDIEADTIKSGAKLIIPNAEPLRTIEKVQVKKIVPKISEKIIEKSSEQIIAQKDSLTANTSTVSTNDTSATDKKYVAPISGAVLTQGVHDGNAVDFGVPIGTAVEASAAGVVIIAKGNGYNGGYGKYIVLNHKDGSQTLYGHLSKVSVSAGDSVDQGDTIGLSGNSGNSTGPHLHYKEINSGTRNTFAKIKIGTEM